LSGRLGMLRKFITPSLMLWPLDVSDGPHHGLSETTRKGTSMTRIKVVARMDTRAAVRGEEASQARDIDAEDEDYYAARDALLEQVPEGWLIIGGIEVPDRAERWARSQAR
jgi:hypothetical protein